MFIHSYNLFLIYNLLFGYFHSRHPHGDCPVDFPCPHPQGGVSASPASPSSTITDLLRPLMSIPPLPRLLSLTSAFSSLSSLLSKSNSNLSLSPSNLSSPPWHMGSMERAGVHLRVTVVVAVMM